MFKYRDIMHNGKKNGMRNFVEILQLIDKFQFSFYGHTLPKIENNAVHKNATKSQTFSTITVNCSSKII